MQLPQKPCVDCRLTHVVPHIVSPPVHPPDELLLPLDALEELSLDALEELPLDASPASLTLLAPPSPLAELLLDPASPLEALLDALLDPDSPVDCEPLEDDDAPLAPPSRLLLDPLDAEVLADELCVWPPSLPGDPPSCKLPTSGKLMMLAHAVTSAAPEAAPSASVRRRMIRTPPA